MNLPPFAGDISSTHHAGCRCIASTGVSRSLVNGRNNLSLQTVATLSVFVLDFPAMEILAKLGFIFLVMVAVMMPFAALLGLL